MSVAMALAEAAHHGAQRLGEPRGPQDQDQPRTMEQGAAYALMVQILEIPVPQLVEQLVSHALFRDASACSRAGYRSAQALAR